jgi:hypothetical protein
MLMNGAQWGYERTTWVLRIAGKTAMKRGCRGIVEARAAPA